MSIIQIRAVTIIINNLRISPLVRKPNYVLYKTPWITLKNSFPYNKIPKPLNYSSSSNNTRH